MSNWVSESVDLLTVLASQCLSEPFIYISGLFILIIVSRLFKRLGG